MWEINNDTKKWSLSTDEISKDSFDVLKQEMSKLRFYSKCLSGSSYLPMNDSDSIYDILDYYEPKNWYISSPYSSTPIPSQYASPVSATNSSTYYDKYLGEYGLTLKNLYTPDKLIKDSINNYLYVDVATTEPIILGQIKIGLSIDGVFLKSGHRVLVKDQITNVVLSNSIDPNVYFKGQYIIINNYGLTIEYQYYNESNGIYIYKNNILTREPDLDTYENCIRYSISVKLGDINREKQFHLSRLTSGYYPTTIDGDPIHFVEKHNWMLRNRVDYNNLFEVNYYDVIKHATQSYYLNGITYSIPTRSISVGQYGVILNNQEGVSNIVTNKYKSTLRSISQTTNCYWISGDDGLILKLRKHDLSVERIDLPVNLISISSISFFSDLRGVAVGDFNTILITDDGGISWSLLEIPELDSFDYNRVIYYKIDRFYVSGNTGVFIEFTFSSNQWNAYKRRVSSFINSDDEYLLVENINDMIATNMNWGLSYSYGSYSIPTNKDLLILTTNNGNIITYDMTRTVPEFDFLYFNFGENYGDIKSIVREGTSQNFYFSTGENGIYSFNIDDFRYITSSESNIISGTYATPIDSIIPNEMYDFNGIELAICGNTSLFDYMTYSIGSFNEIDSLFDKRLRSKMLFLDYDIGSKLNFFDSSQNYRMPNSLTFSSSTFSSVTVDFEPLPSELNWFSYWSDRQKTFEYSSSSPLDGSSMVEMSSKFKYYSGPTSSTLSYFTSSNVTISLNDINPLAPNISNKSLGRFDIATASINSPLTTTYSIFLYDYLMILQDDPSVNPTEVGDILRFDSDVVTTDIIINKIVNFGTYSYYYGFTEFNQNIINQIKTGSSIISIKNLNKYKDIDELYDRFNQHPLSIGYDMKYDGSVVEFSPKFSNYTSYYNLATNILIGSDTFTMSYEDKFMEFGYNPTYNIYSYLNSINSSIFTSSKEYLAMPIYNGLPVGPLTPSTIFIDTNITTNKIYFGSNFKFEWESIFINTFIEVILYGSTSYDKKRLLILEKYYDSSLDSYIIEFHRNVWNINTDGYDVITSIDILSRRELATISDDLFELNSIQRRSGVQNETEIHSGFEYTNLENELNFKISTDSYAKILLSDVETVKEISAIIYVDYKNELAMNVTRLDREYEIPILNTINYSGNLLISCSKSHDLSDGDSVVLEFTGGTGSSQQLNQQYFGYHIVNVVTPLSFYINMPYGAIPLVGNDIGVVKYTKKDSFFNYSPVDIIDVGIDKKGKRSVILNPDNVNLSGYTYTLVNVDYNKHRFRLVDGLNIDILTSRFPWILEAEIEDAIIGMDSDKSLIWYSGTWLCGRWFGGIWKSGIWKSGDWYDGIWESRSVKDKLTSVEVDNSSIVDNSHSTWYGGRWYAGTWNAGTWYSGRWYGGEWKNGIWFDGTWNDGIWDNGKFFGGIWVLGQWNNGIFNTNNTPAYWLDGKWYGGDFENGMWYTGIFDEKNSKISRFGTNAFNTRTATWHGGKWSNGEFHSNLNIDENGKSTISKIHKFSIWNTGIWSSGDWYGGIAYDIDFRSGTWHGGIVEDIQIIGVDIINNTFTLNGIFKYNIGDKLNVIDNQLGNLYSVYGSNNTPTSYTILYTTEDPVNKWTTVYVASVLSGPTASGYNTGLRAVSTFNGNWKSGIWTNGLFENGLWEGGLWYNGVFSGDWS